jgi:hypothetical protein
MILGTSLKLKNPILLQNKTRKTAHNKRGRSRRTVDMAPIIKSVELPHRVKLPYVE